MCACDVRASFGLCLFVCLIAFVLILFTRPGSPKGPGSFLGVPLLDTHTHTILFQPAFGRLAVLGPFWQLAVSANLA